MKQDLFYKPIYCRLKRIGVKTALIAERLGITRTAMRNWFDYEMLDEERSKALIQALQQFEDEVHDVIKELKNGFKVKRRK